MRLLLVFTAPLCSSLRVGRGAGWTQSRQQGLRLHLIKHPYLPLTDEQSATPFSVYSVGSPGRIEQLDRRFEEEQRGLERRVLELEEEVRRLR